MSTEAGIVTRRHALGTAFNGLGALALGGLLSAEGGAAVPAPGPGIVRPPHHPPRARHCIFLFMAGGVSQVDTFEHKPVLAAHGGGRMSGAGVDGALAGKIGFPHAVFPSPFRFRRYGESGRELAELFPALGSVVDRLAFVHGIRVDNENHGPATSHATTGHVLPGSPSIGSWVTYGLGSPAANLPGYVVIQDPRGTPVNGAAVWGNGYLPATYQGTLLRPAGVPILDLVRPADTTAEGQRRQVELLRWLDERHRDGRPAPDELDARIRAYELAFRMQQAAPELVDLAGETPATLALYGLDQPTTAGFGRQCLLARRLVERGVRFTLLVHGVQISPRSWDDHGDLERRMRNHAAEVDRPVAALLADLARRGLLDETLVVWASEMGRTPFVPGEALRPNSGRDHNPYGLVMWMAGGGIRAGATVGASDDFGLRAAGEPIPLRDVHATILRLLGLDDQRLTYLANGRFRRLTDIGGRVLDGLIA